MSLLIGIDTGGTFTDAVVFHETDGVMAKAKARTRTDLTVGIAEALDAVVAGLGPDPVVSLVSLSTTLATNALVEGVGGRVALVGVGLSEVELMRGGLAEALGDSPVIAIDGGHDSMGAELIPVDLEGLMARVEALPPESIDAFAVAGQFSVRNPEHELRVREALTGLGRPVACGHELSVKLNGPKRALTCLLNARLIALITDLCQAAETILADRAIDAPLMLVRGDGSLVTADFAKARPIETILSGPAASVVGAGHLTGASQVIVADIGGTTTDVGILSDGRPAISEEGATVGGHRTMIEAVEMFTHGLGGDSEVELDVRAHPARLRLGPRRVLPLSQLALHEPGLVHRTLESRGFPYRDHHTMFAAPRSAGRGPRTRATGLSEREHDLLDRMGHRPDDGSLGRWTPLDRVVHSSLDGSALRTLVGRGLVRLAGFTPTDATVVLGRHSTGDEAAAAMAAELMAGAGDAGGDAVRPDGKSLAQWVIDTLIRRSAEAVLAAALHRDGFEPVLAESVMARAALDGHRGVTALRIGADLDLVGLGASAPTYYPAVAEQLSTRAIVPEHAEVANAIGAVVGRVRISRTATLSQPTKGQYRVHLPGIDDFGDLDPAIRAAEDELRSLVRADAEAAGADEIGFEVDVDTTTATVSDKEVFVEGKVTVVGSGRPRLARPRST